MAQPAPWTIKQSDALSAYKSAVSGFKLILTSRRDPDRFEQWAELRDRTSTLAQQHESTYKDLTDALPRGSEAQQFGIPTAIYDVANEPPMLDEYRELSICWRRRTTFAQKIGVPPSRTSSISNCHCAGKGDSTRRSGSGRQYQPRDVFWPRQTAIRCG